MNVSDGSYGRNGETNGGRNDMGDRYSWTENCPKCGEPMNVYYAESCEKTSEKCHKCGTTFDIVMDFKLVERKGTKRRNKKCGQ